MKILSIDEAGLRFEREADGYWLDGRCITLHRVEGTAEEKTYIPTAVFWDDDAIRIISTLKEMAGYVVFLEAYCSKRMSAEKARKRFILSDDARALLL